jgi:hypothetical protein
LLCLAGVSWTLWRRVVEHQRARKAGLLRAMRHVSDAEAAQSQAHVFRRWAALPRILAQAEHRAIALAARSAARTVQDAFAAWASYAAAMSDATAVCASDVFLEPRSSEVRS